MSILVRAYNANDWPSVERIYQEGIDTGLATFETSPKAQSNWESGHVGGSALVAVDDEKVLGWAVLWPVSDRCAYAGVAEVSVYVSADARGKGVGTLLLSELVATSEQLGLWTLQAGIFAENMGSIELHKRCGFREIGVREKLGALHGDWKDVMLMERRSGIIGR